MLLTNSLHWNRNRLSETSENRSSETNALRIDVGGPQEQNAGGDTVPGSVNTTFTIAVGGQQNGFVNTVGDDDWYRVTLVAGESYEFALTGATLPDAYLELYDASGQLIAIDDDFGSGINSLLRFTATTSGTYYVNARAYEDATTSNTGSYTLTANVAAPASPLDSIDYHFTMPTSNIAVWFAGAGYTNPSSDTATRAWTQAEINAVMAALATYSAVSPLTFSVAASQAGATWIFSLANLPGNTLGYFAVGGNYAAFDPAVPGFTAGLTPGGNSWVTIIHEAGHGLGLAHPHDNGASGANNSEIMQGVTNPFGSYGTFSMNQGVFTTMSYNDGWALSGFGATPSGLTGGQATPMALDVALIQQNYGVNATTGSGDTVRVLGSSSSAYYCIWDVSGVDTISFSGSADCTIDLRAATLANAVGGGGFVSFVSGVHGGFTIANGVVIENATGGSGNDLLIGNAADNRFNGGGGIDTLSYAGAAAGVFVALYKQSWVVNEQVTGGAGTDTLTGIEKLFGSAFADNLLGSSAGDTIDAGAGDDAIEGRAGADSLYGGAGNDFIYGEEGDDFVLGNSGNDFLSGSLGLDALFGGDGNDTLASGADADTLDGGADDDKLFGGDGNDTIYSGDGANDRVFGEDGNDTINITQSSGSGFALVEAGDGDDLINVTGLKTIEAYGDAGADTINSGDGNDYISGGLGNDTIRGGAGNDTLVGGQGDDVLDAGAGNDRLFGNDGADRFTFLADAMAAGTTDSVIDWEDGVDKIVLPSAFASSLQISASAFGTYLSFGNGFGIIIEGLSPASFTAAGDIIFV